MGAAVTPGQLLRYRVMAFTTATLLIILVFVGVPLQIFDGYTGVVNTVGTLHGFLYIGYLFVAFSLTYRLRVPKWQMALVLLAGTVPFCAFVAERKMSRKFAAAVGATPGEAVSEETPARSVSRRGRWLSRRALLLHAEVLVVAPGCAAAGWWQATRALAGNQLSWVYSVEWPIFALIAIAGWWHLVHEDPDSYRRRRAARPDEDHIFNLGPAQGSGDAGLSLTGSVHPVVARVSKGLLIGVALEVAVGLAGLFVVPFDRPKGWVPTHGETIYLAHALVGTVVIFSAVGFAIWVQSAGRTARIAGWMGLSGLGIAGLGGMMAAGSAVLRFFGLALMVVGPLIAVFAYSIPAIALSPRRLAAREEMANA